MKHTFLASIEHAMFRPVTTKGFGLMRVSFAAITILSFIFQWQDISTYYSNAGLVPIHAIPDFLRTEYRFSIFDSIGDPVAIMWIYYVFLLALLFVMLGIFTRPALFLSVFLLFSFHERLWAVLAGGDTMLRMVGFILLLSPCHRSFSVWSLRQRFHTWNASKKDPVQKLAVMPAWPYILLFWQLFIIYITAAWTKALGSMWWDGSAISIAMRHPFFSRVPLWFLPVTDATAWMGAHFVLLAQFSWAILFLIPIIQFFFPASRTYFDRVPWKLIVLGANTLVHLLIAVMMDVGLFSFIMIASFMGLLDERDFAWLRALGKKMVHGQTVVLYDGSCMFCKKSIFALHTCDWLRTIKLVDYRDAAQRKKFAPALALKKLNEAMHVQGSRGVFTKGFYAFRTLSWRVPPLWISIPMLYIPGVSVLGERIYKKIAALRCADGCTM